MQDRSGFIEMSFSIFDPKNAGKTVENVNFQQPELTICNRSDRTTFAKATAGKAFL